MLPTYKREPPAPPTSELFMTHCCRMSTMMIMTFSTSMTDSVDVSPKVAGSTDNVWDDADIMIRIRRGGE
jgi:hypothetical protein